VLSYVIPALAIAYSLATSAYVLVNLPRLEQLAKEMGVAIPQLTVALLESGVPIAAGISLLVACATVLPIFLSARTATHVIAGALILIPSLLLSSVIFLAVFLPLRRIVDGFAAA
jgi:hypothetical protein